MDTREKYIQSLENKINKAKDSEEFELGAGSMVIEWLKDRITFLTNKVLSDEFVNDHNGYLKAVATVQAHQSLLNMLAVSKAEGPKAQDALNIVNNG